MIIPASVSDEPKAKERLKEMMLYVAGLCMNDSTFGATKLSKILYFADTLSYARHGEPITGAKYKSMPNGPVPISLLDLKDEMVHSDEMAVRRERVMNYERHRYLPLREANLDNFSGREIAIINEVKRLLIGYTATQVSDLSHGIAWRVYKGADFIPMEAVFLSDEGITEADAGRAQELISQHGWYDV